jgi:folate receptor
MALSSYSRGLAVFPILFAQDGASQPVCRPFHEIYDGGREICENMWGGAFTYEEDESQAYTMWFFDATNPNDALSQQNGHITDEHEVCHLQYFHKDAPGPEPETFTECLPWKDDACCAQSTVMSAQTIKEAYGAEYHWDRCGPLSPECERFFVQEACFYECDPNAGYYRRWDASVYDARCDQYAEGYDATYAEAQGCDHNTWQMHQMPIKASYCDAWFRACRNDLFCSSDDGDYFSCAAEYAIIDEAAELQQQLAANQAILDEARQNVTLARREAAEAAEAGESEEDNLPLLIGLVALGVVALCSCSGAMYLIRREKSGKPVFGKLLESNAAQGGATYGNSA